MGVDHRRAAVRRLRHRLQRDLRQHRTAVPLCRRARRDRRLHLGAAQRPGRHPDAAGHGARHVGAAVVGGLLSWVAVSRRSTSSSPASSRSPSRWASTTCCSASATSPAARPGSWSRPARTRSSASWSRRTTCSSPSCSATSRCTGCSSGPSIGWAFRALRDDEMAAELAGVDVKRCRVLAGMIGSAMLGLAGALYAHSEGFIAPSTFAFGNVDVRVLVMLAFGGVGSLLGPVVGAADVHRSSTSGWCRSTSSASSSTASAILVLFLGFRRGVVPAVQSLVDHAAAGRRSASSGTRGSQTLAAGRRRRR